MLTAFYLGFESEYPVIIELFNISVPMLIITRSQNKNINPNSVIFLSSYADAAN
jgi:hypothetical protein